MKHSIRRLNDRDLSEAIINELDGILKCIPEVVVEKQFK